MGCCKTTGEPFLAMFYGRQRAVSWSSKKQELVTLSTMEAEYITATHAAKEAIDNIKIDLRSRNDALSSDKHFPFWEILVTC